MKPDKPLKCFGKKTIVSDGIGEIQLVRLDEGFEFSSADMQIEPGRWIRSS